MPQPRVAVDAMGGDHGAAVVVEGALLASRELGVAVSLVGPEPLLRAAQAWALMHAHPGVLPEDVQAVLPSVAGHRLAPRESSRFRDAGQVGQFVLETVPVP